VYEKGRAKAREFIRDTLKNAGIPEGIHFTNFFCHILRANTQKNALLTYQRRINLFTTFCATSPTKKQFEQRKNILKLDAQQRLFMQDLFSIPHILYSVLFLSFSILFNSLCRANPLAQV
jgi:hypothetical protein